METREWNNEEQQRNETDGGFIVFADITAIRGICSVVGYNATRWRQPGTRTVDHVSGLYRNRAHCLPTRVAWIQSVRGLELVAACRLASKRVQPTDVIAVRCN